jgi:hypothetical protein
MKVKHFELLQHATEAFRSKEMKNAKKHDVNIDPRLRLYQVKQIFV